MSETQLSMCQVLRSKVQEVLDATMHNFLPADFLFDLAA